MWGFLAALGVGSKLIKEKADDLYVKDNSIKNGSNFYASSTGIRDVKTNRKVFINSAGRMIDVKTYKDLGASCDMPAKKHRYHIRHINGKRTMFDLSEMAKKEGKKYYEYRIGEYGEVGTDRKVRIDFHEVEDLETGEFIRTEPEYTSNIALTYMDWTRKVQLIEEETQAASGRRW